MKTVQRKVSSAMSALLTTVMLTALAAPVALATIPEPDTTAPTGTIVINGGATVTGSNGATLALSAADASGVASMQFSKNGTTWYAWEPYATTRVVTLTVAPGEGDGLKTIYVRYRDPAGNVSPVYSAGITLNRTAPMGTIAINGGATLTKSASAALALSATDDNGVASMQFSKNGATWYAWEPYATSRTVTLTAVPGEADGAKTIYVRYRDTAGNVSPVYSAGITLDRTPPTGSILINGGAATSASLSVTLALTATDANGVASMEFSKNGTTWYPWEIYKTARVATLLGVGETTIYVKFRDTAGNVSAVYSAAISYDNGGGRTGAVSGSGK
jgi:hypothetical protein